jgi:hypothetical protein
MVCKEPGEELELFLPNRECGLSAPELTGGQVDDKVAETDALMPSQRRPVGWLIRRNVPLGPVNGAGKSELSEKQCPVHCRWRQQG